MELNEIKKELETYVNPEKPVVLQRFFKTGEGEYGEGDIFIGVSVPDCRKVAQKFSDLNLEEVKEIIYSEIHEVRLTGWLILVGKFKKCDENSRREIYDFYLKHAKQVNNWDLVDLSCSNIVGGFLLDKKDRGVLDKLAKSDNLWEKRIAIVSCFAFIRENDFKDILKISENLLGDKHDLIHKAIGWMLREVGKRDVAVLEKFLKEHYEDIPRTTLRYAIERFDEKKRKAWLRGAI